MSEITTIGLDLAKHVFQVHGFDAQGTTVVRKRLRRGQVLAFFSRIPRCVVGLEACATAHYWSRELGALGHEVRLRRTSSAISTTPPMPKRFAKPLGDRPCGLCRLRRQSNRQVSCCIVAASSWCASARCW